LVGCSDGDSVTAPADVKALAEVDGMSQRPGAVVDKSGAFVVWFGGGPPTNLAVQVGIENPVEDFCADPSSVTPSPQSAIVIFTPSGKVPTHTVSREAFAFVFEYSGGIVVDPCVLIGAPVVATGRVFFTQSVIGGGPGAFVFQVTAHGIVELTAGGLARLHGSGRFVVRPDGTVVKDQEPVTLTPL
jgi:hypothetical protein